MAVICSFLLQCDTTSYKYVMINLSIFYVDGCLNGFQFGTIMGNATVNILLHVFYAHMCTFLEL